MSANCDRDQPLHKGAVRIAMVDLWRRTGGIYIYLHTRAEQKDRHLSEKFTCQTLDTQTICGFVNWVSTTTYQDCCSTSDRRLSETSYRKCGEKARDCCCSRAFSKSQHYTDDGGHLLVFYAPYDAWPLWFIHQFSFEVEIAAAKW